MTDTSTTKGPAPLRVIFVITGCQKPDRTAQVDRVKTVRVFTSRLVVSMV